MLISIIDAGVAVGSLMLFWFLIRAYLRKIRNISPTDPDAIDDYLRKITQITGVSAYDTFRISADAWRVPEEKIDQDFKLYLSTQRVPYYVKDFVRRNQEHIDESLKEKGRAFADKRVLLFYSVLTLVFWGGAVLLCVFVFPYILPQAVLETSIQVGPP
jgi:hypothetical protein